MIATGLFLWIAAGCSPPGSSARPSRDESKKLEPGILRAVDLLPVPELGLMRRLTEAEVPNYQGPDFRGACGRVMAQPEAANRLAVAFVGEQATLSQVIVELDAEEAGELIGNLKEDSPAACDPQVIRTPQGQVQTYVQGPLVDIGEVGDERVASRGTVEVEGTRVNLLTILIRSGGLLLFGLVSTETQLDPDAVQRLAQLMGTQFEELTS
jgi:hypothetical protein